jgi:hypothetical protein
MSYKVTAPLVIVSPSDADPTDNGGNAGPRYFYEGGVILDGYNDDRCDELVAEKMLEKVSVSKDGDVQEPKADSVDAILADVGEDKEKAQAALDAENAKSSPRKTLVSKLEAIVKAE